MSHAMLVTDRLFDVELGGCLANVVEDRASIRNGFRITPRTERITERVHVRVGTDARITKQIPGAAQRVAAFEYDEILLRALTFQMAGRADPRQPCAHNYHVEVLHRDRKSTRLNSSHVSESRM